MWQDAGMNAYSLVPKKRPGSKPKMDEAALRLLEADFRERPTDKLPQRREFLSGVAGAGVARQIDAERLVFVDEMGTNVSLSPLYAWSPKGERAYCSAPRNWGKNVTLLASITREGLGECLAVEGSTTREVFDAYLERVLMPTLRAGQIVVMDNLSAHKGGRVKEIIEGRGCELLYLPP
jgi:hypothetical protein